VNFDFLLHKTTSSPTVGENVELTSQGFLNNSREFSRLFLKRAYVSLCFQVREAHWKGYIHHWLLATKTGGRRNAYSTACWHSKLLFAFCFSPPFPCSSVLKLLGLIFWAGLRFAPVAMISWFARQTKHENDNPHFHFPPFPIFILGHWENWVAKKLQWER
jgi:hypothetical protein